MVGNETNIKMKDLVKFMRLLNSNLKNKRWKTENLDWRWP